ncbi:MAG: asparagine synthetase B, partial [Deltaproteobacteria bacterium]|nr:asparagine synthetase B [Deltaproteobacteria bacterium]
MCGIVGIVNIGGDLNPQEVWHGVKLLQHRGPDHQDVYVDSDIGFGHARLSILDVSEDGHQPMQSGCGRYVMVYNGEIYNFRELRRAHLGEHRFR